MRSLRYLCALALLLPCACKDEPEPMASGSESDSGSTDTPGDGDPTGDGDPVCEIATEGCPCTQGGSCNPGLICDGGICTGCEIATEGCPCTDGGSCNPGLLCDGGVCLPASGDGDGDPGDGDPGDGDPGDGDPGDGDPGDGDGDPDPPDPPDPTEFVDLGDFMIGTTEVRVQEYGTFLVANVGFNMLPPECSWKQSYEPDQWNGQVQAGADLPVRRVDWCDAWAYCWWAGGHLCGNIAGGPATLGQANDAAESEWYHACTNDDATTYPYGDVYEPDYCNGVDAGLNAVQPAGSMLFCEGGAMGLFDMSGNLWEWTNACAEENVSDQNQDCRRRGGSYVSDQNLLRCSVGSVRPRNTREVLTGIRCCADSP